MALNLADPEEKDEKDKDEKKEQKETKDDKSDEKKAEKAKVKVQPPSFVGSPAIRSGADRAVVMEVRVRSETPVTAAWWHGEPVSAHGRVALSQAERAGIHTLNLRIRVRRADLQGRGVVVASNELSNRSTYCGRLASCMGRDITNGEW